MQVIDGKKIANKILGDLKIKVSQLPFQPLFCDILAGDDPVSLSYVKIKGKTAESVGIAFRLEQLGADVSESDLLKKIAELNAISHMCGLIVQLPLPPHINRQAVLDAIKPEIDVDCLGTENSNAFYNGESDFIPPTAAAVMRLIDELPAEYRSGQFAVVGQGQLVGKPVTHLLAERGYKVRTADKNTENVSAITSGADVIISATGRASLITTDFIKSGSAVIDAGTAEMDGGIAGDVDFKNIAQKTGFITPVPGGVGPVTVSMLLYNVVKAAQQKQI